MRKYKTIRNIACAMLFTLVIPLARSADEKIEVENQGQIIEVEYVSIQDKEGKTLLSSSVSRKRYRPLPIGGHLHVYVWDDNDDLIAEDVYRLRDHHFKRLHTGRILPARYNLSIPIGKEKITKVRVESFQMPHDNCEKIEQATDHLC